MTWRVPPGAAIRTAGIILILVLVGFAGCLGATPRPPDQVDVPEPRLGDRASYSHKHSYQDAWNPGFAFHMDALRDLPDSNLAVTQTLRANITHAARLASAFTSFDEQLLYVHVWGRTHEWTPMLHVRHTTEVAHENSTVYSSALDLAPVIGKPRDIHSRIESRTAYANFLEPRKPLYDPAGLAAFSGLQGKTLRLGDTLTIPADMTPPLLSRSPPTEFRVDRLWSHNGEGHARLVPAAGPAGSELIVSDQSPYPIYSGNHQQAYRLEELHRGPPMPAAREPERPDWLEQEPYWPNGPPGSTVFLDYPLERAVADVQNDPTRLHYKLWRRDHPWAVLTSANHYPDNNGAWSFTWADNGSTFSVFVRKELPILPLDGLIAPNYGEPAGFPGNAADAPRSVLTLEGAAAAWSLLLPETPLPSSLWVRLGTDWEAHGVEYALSHVESRGGPETGGESGIETGRRAQMPVDADESRLDHFFIETWTNYWQKAADD